MRQPIVGIGAGGHARAVIETLRLAGPSDIIGLLDSDARNWGLEVLGIPVLGNDDLLGDLHRQGVNHAFVGVGSVGWLAVRRRLYEMLVKHGLCIVTAIHPTAYVSTSAKMGQGLTMLPRALLHSQATAGDNVLVNSAAVVEHDCQLGNHVHIATGALLASGVRVGDETHVGVGAVVRQGIRIGNNVTVGAGAVVVHDVPDNVVIAGNPAKLLRSQTNDHS